MLDWTHGLVLKAVANGSTNESPALKNLQAAGLVTTEMPPKLTPAGQSALEAKKGRVELWAYRALLLGLTVYFLADLLA